VETTHFSWNLAVGRFLFSWFIFDHTLLLVKVKGERYV